MKNTFKIDLFGSNLNAFSTNFWQNKSIYLARFDSIFVYPTSVAQIWLVRDRENDLGVFQLGFYSFVFVF